MNLFASVLHLDRQAVKALRITDAYSLHRVVYSLYEDVRTEPQKQGNTPSGILYADQGGDVRGRKILLLANRQPKDSAEDKNGDKHGEVLSKSISEEFIDHEKYRFNVVVNPTRRDSASRKLVAMRGRDDIAQWFAERAKSSWGFDIAPQHLQVNKIDVLQFKDKSQRQITMGQAHIQGQLRVMDKEQFVQSFTQGIGRGRAYGCGLLQIVPVVDELFS